MSPSANALCGYLKMSPLSFFFYLSMLCYTNNNIQAASVYTFQNLKQAPALHLSHLQSALHIRRSDSVFPSALHLSRVPAHSALHLSRVPAHSALHLSRSHASSGRSPFDTFSDHTSEFNYMKCDPAYIFADSNVHPDSPTLKPQIRGTFSLSLKRDTFLKRGKSFYDFN